MSACHVITYVQSDADYWVWGGKPKNLYFTGGNLQVFFNRGVNQKTPKWQGGKSHLTQNKITKIGLLQLLVSY